MILRSTRDPAPASTSATFSEAAERSLAPDGGLYLPDPLPRFADVEDLLALDFRPRSLEILGRLLGDEIPRADLAAEPNRGRLALFSRPKWAQARNPCLGP